MEFFDKLPNTVKQIDDSKDYIDIDGTVYGIEYRRGRKNYGRYFRKAQTKCYGYKYASVYRNSLGTTVRMRVHKLVAKAFVHNDCPELKNIVGHRNNIKDDNRAENLYWTTTSENTQKAYDDGLAANAKGWEDSQSLSVSQYDTYTNKHIADYGSAREAEKVTGISMSTILRQCRYKRPHFNRTKTYFRFVGDESTIKRGIIIARDFKTDKEIARYLNATDASRETGISSGVIAKQIRENRKPKWTKAGMYFLQRDISSDYKCEQTIEMPKAE